jgi:hypothetical protein
VLHGLILLSMYWWYLCTGLLLNICVIWFMVTQLFTVFKISMFDLVTGLMVLGKLVNGFWL